MRITFSICTRHYRAYDHYIKKPKSMCEIGLNQALAEIPPVIKFYIDIQIVQFLENTLIEV